jgi:NCK adaptor protein
MTSFCVFFFFFFPPLFPFFFCVQAGDYSVSLKAPGRNKHFRVHVENGLFCIGQRKFDSLDKLVEHYQRAPIYTSQREEKLYLIRPLPRPPPSMK